MSRRPPLMRYWGPSLTSSVLPMPASVGPSVQWRIHATPLCWCIRSQDLCTLGPSVLSIQMAVACRLVHKQHYLTKTRSHSVPPAHLETRQVHNGAGIASRTRGQDHRSRCQSREEHEDARPQIVLAHRTIVVLPQSAVHPRIYHDPLLRPPFEVGLGDRSHNRRYLILRADDQSLR